MKKLLIFVLPLLFLTGCSSKNVTSNYTAEKSSYSYNHKDEDMELSAYSSTIYTKTSERQNNIKLACNELNNTIVNPGETFSFCDTLGPAKPEDGYQKADTFDTEGDIYKEYGGGKCQVSSTLYNAVKDIPGIEIIERHEHSNYVPYVQEGQDAAVAYGSVDFKFRNNNAYPIMIKASATDDEVIIKIVKIIF
ncbi:MAG: VanW family protein [Clostridia bacterium]|nr:VanW family protein [Clostridia bacterium]